MIVGLICAYQEAKRIGDAVCSLFAAGCDGVVVVDGAWRNPDGSWFGGADEPYSSDWMDAAAVEAGACVVKAPEECLGSDGDKREWAIHNCLASKGDHLLLLDADERLSGQLDDPPSGHGCLMLHNRPDELGFRTPWLDEATLSEIPLLRWLRYSEELRCEAPGVYFDKHGLIEPYLVPILARHPEVERDPHLGQAYRAIREHRRLLPPVAWTVLPILDGLSIEHLPADPGKTEAKRVYYGHATETMVAA